MNFDYIIVGGGSAGCVLANRLSADPRIQVALIESGPDTHPEHISDQIYSLPFLPHYFEDAYYWKAIEAYMDPIGNAGLAELRRSGKSRVYEQAKVMGGGSTVNGQVAIRGLPSDYDEWVDLGAKGWSFEECLPYFKKLERDLDFSGEFNGSSGPLPIHRIFPDQWGGLSLAFREALREQGIPYYDDCHSNFGDGCFPFPKNNVYGHRVSAVLAYLDGATRQRRNLHLVPDSSVSRVVFDERRASGVLVLRDGEHCVYSGDEIIVSCGALNSPGLLMRSGVGPGEHLSELGIDVVFDSQGVGRNLQEHPLVGIGMHLKPEARLSPSLRSNFLINSRFSSNHPGCPAQDMKLSVSNRFAWSKIGSQLGTVQFGPNKAYSQGVVSLKGPDLNSGIVAAFNLLSDPRDLQRMIDGVRFAHRLVTSSPVSNMINMAFPGVYSDMMRNLTTVSKKNKVLTDFAAFILDNSGPFQKTATKAMAGAWTDLGTILKNETALVDWIRRGVQGDWHACGTCKMGSASDRMAVVDHQGWLKGVDGVRVVDASIMPSVPCANTNVTTMMIAEKVADDILSSRRA